MSQLIRFSLALILSLLSALPSVAAPPQTLNYQGYLTSPTGTPTNTPVVMTFRLYNAVSGGAALYTETQLSVSVTNGSFNAVIGAVTPIPLPFDVPYWLSVQVNGDAEMSPRQPLASSPYAFRAASVDAAATIAGTQITGSLAGATLPATQITGTINAATAATVSGSVSGSQITGAITTATIGGAQITGTINAPGNIVLPQSTASIGNIMKGATPFIHNFGSQNTFIGENAGNFAMTGIGNTAAGFLALYGNTTGYNNTASGYSPTRPAAPTLPAVSPRSPPTRPAPTTPPAAVLRSSPTRPAAPTLPAAVLRSSPTRPAAPTLPAAVLRSETTRPETTTLPAVTLRSTTTPPATTTLPLEFTRATTRQSAAAIFMSAMKPLPANRTLSESAAAADLPVTTYAFSRREFAA